MQLAYESGMSRLPRNQLISESGYFHITWQCHDKKWLLKADHIKNLYYDLLIKYKDAYNMIFNGYHFMENHIHLIGEVESAKLFSNFFRVVNGVFARQINHRLRRRGQVVMERLKSPMIRSDAQMIRALAYLDLNGVRAGRDKRPGENIWSSYSYYAFGKADDLLTPAPSYQELGSNSLERKMSYRSIVATMLVTS